MDRSKDKLINDKTLPEHNFFTKELIWRKIITSESDFDLYVLYLLFLIFPSLMLAFYRKLEVHMFQIQMSSLVTHFTLVKAGKY